MNIAGVICEYNPFHNGHLLHVNLTRERTGCDYVIAVMSGAFTQRGDPAMADKWTRARMALKNGVDLVVELPAAFAVRPADKFALGGVDILSRLGCKTLSFGCETDDLGMISKIADMTRNEDESLSNGIRVALSRGCSHARARGEAMAKELGIDPKTLNLPNTALAIEYVKSNARLANPMELLAIKREGDYHDLRLGELCSASAIRKAAYAGEDYKSAMPVSAYGLIDKGLLSDAAALDNILLYALRNADPEWLKKLPEPGEGAYMLLKKHAESASGRDDLLLRAKCKRYTLSRLNRMATYVMLGIESERLAAIERPPYARALGFRKSSRGLMRYLNENAQIPFVTDAVKLKQYDCFAIENMVTDLWSLTTKDPAARAAGRDYTNQIVIEE